MKSNRALRKELRDQTILLDRIERRFIRPYFKEIKRAMDRMATSFVNNPKDLEFSAIMKTHERLIGRVMDKNWNVSGKIFFDRTRKSLVKIEKKTLQEDFDEAMDEYVDKYASEKITSVTQTTKDQVTIVIQNGLAAGEGVEVIAKSIREKALRSSRYRSHMIARTETHSSANYGNQVGAKLTGLKLVKFWLAARQERTRLWHLKADGQKRDIDEPFLVNGEKLDYCGDPNGSADNVINCRCVVAYDEEG